MQVMIEISDKEYKKICKHYNSNNNPSCSELKNDSMIDLIDRELVLLAIEQWITYGEYKYSNATEYLVNRIKRITPTFKQIPITERLPKEKDNQLIEIDH